MQFADIIVDISHENLDKTFQYAIPEELLERAVIGAPVTIPFGNGNRTRKGYIVGLSDSPKIEPERIKSVLTVEQKGLVLESRMIALAEKMRSMYGGTLNDALRTVSPVKQSVKPVQSRTVCLIADDDTAKLYLAECEKKNHKAKARLLTELLSSHEIDYELLLHKLNISGPTLQSLEKAGIVAVSSERKYRMDGQFEADEASKVILNDEQQAAVNRITLDFNSGERNIYLLHGVTGSGKTEVYMAAIENVIARGKQAIMLIPEISLTYQTVKRFSKRFGNRVSFLHSRLSEGERYDQYLRAKNGELDIIIGPRSALFTPFENPGIIIIDEEHENSYKSEQIPKYHTREIAIEYAKMVGAQVILGSATPSVESYYRAQNGEFTLLELKKRAGEANLPKVYIADMREELKAKNISIFSRKLRELIEDRLQKKQQIMLFINRRGYAGFVSCRACGEALMCPHCAVSLTAHNNSKLMCHYCGYETDMPKTCPKCGSKYIAAFGTGTQKIEALVQKEFPNARVLRMDADTTKDKQGHERILEAFSNDEADILVGTQMIVKGHDFGRVTLMGIIAADMSLLASDFRSAERTFELLAQAAGRSGRANLPGEVVIQTYRPEHYAVTMAATEDYKGFYENEMMYRSILSYPPAANLCAVLISSESEEEADSAATFIAGLVGAWLDENDPGETTSSIGPAKAGIEKIRDRFRYVLYLKSADYGMLIRCKDYAEERIKNDEVFKNCIVQFDFNPMSGY